MPRFRLLKHWLLWTIGTISLTGPLAVWMLAPWRPSHWLAQQLLAGMAAAVQILSTTANPRIRRQLEALEQTETDEEVYAALRNAHSVR